MELFYASGNSSKIYNMRRRLEGTGVNIITPKDVGLNLDIEEDGNSVEENAIKKAIAYYGKIDITTVAGDSGLHIDVLPSDKQPGLFVRRVNGKVMSDDEMIDYYSHLVSSFGGQSRAHYITGLALVMEGKQFSIEIPDDDFILTSKPNKNRVHRGNPLDIITINPVNGKYYNEMTDEEFRQSAWSFDRVCLEFLQKHLNI